MTPIIACLSCVHYEGRMKCKAFPDGIPKPIIRGENMHTEPFPGDHGIRFEPIAAKGA